MPIKKTPTLAQLPHSPAPASVTPASDEEIMECLESSMSFGIETDKDNRIMGRCQSCFGPWFVFRTAPSLHAPECVTVVAPKIIARIERDRAEIAALKAERDEARATKDMHKERAEEAWEELHRLQHQETERNHTLRARLAEVSEAASAFVSAYWDGDAHKKAEALEAILAKGDK